MSNVRVRVLVLRAAGINCDEETMHCWRIAGAAPSLVHLNEVSRKPELLRDVDIVTIPGGFSYGDDIAAGVIFARRLLQDLVQPLRELVERGGGILGICNGFQILVKAGLLSLGSNNGSDSNEPDAASADRDVTVTFNDSSRFEARWVKLAVQSDRCPFLIPGTTLEMPIEHAEGKVVTSSPAVLQALESAGQIALRYVDDQGRNDVYPANPNGSVGGIAGLCDTTGRILGLMPHPDRAFDPLHHPQWTRRKSDATPDGLTVFQNAVRHWSGS